MSISLLRSRNYIGNPKSFFSKFFILTEGLHVHFSHVFSYGHTFQELKVPLAVFQHCRLFSRKIFFPKKHAFLNAFCLKKSVFRAQKTPFVVFLAFLCVRFYLKTP